MLAAKLYGLPPKVREAVPLRTLNHARFETYEESEVEYDREREKDRWSRHHATKLVGLGEVFRVKSLILSRCNIQAT